MNDYVNTVGGSHPALVVIGDDYNRESAPEKSTVLSLLNDDTNYSLDGIYDVREGPVEIQHEKPPTDPYETWGVVVSFQQTPVAVKYSHNGPFIEAVEILEEELDEIEIWIDATQGLADRKPNYHYDY